MPNGNQPSFCVQSVVVGQEETEKNKKKRKKVKCPDEDDYDPSEISEEFEESEELSDYLRRCERRRLSRSYYDPIYSNLRFGGRSSLSLFDSPMLCSRLPPLMDHCMGLPLF